MLAKKNQHGAIIIHMDSWWGRRCVYPDQLLFLLNAKNLLFVLVWRRHLFGLLRSLSVLLFPVIICFCIFIFGFVSISDHCKSFYKQNMLIYNALTMPSSHISGDWGCMHSFFSAKCAKKFGWWWEYEEVWLLFGENNEAYDLSHDIILFKLESNSWQWLKFGSTHCRINYKMKWI